MDIELIGRYVAILAFLIGIANTIGLWISAPGRSIKGRFEGLRDNLKEHDRRIQSVESELRHLPTKDGVNQLSVQMGRLETELETLGSTVRRIDDFLRSHQ